MREVERSELEAVDAVLAGAAVRAEHEELAGLARELRALRALPDDKFARALDHRAAQGFRRPKRRPTRARRLLPAGAGVALAGVAAAAIAFTVLPSAGTHGTAAKSSAARASARLSAGRAETTSGAGSGAAPRAEKGPARGAEAAAAQAPLAARQIERGSTLDLGVPPAAVQSTAQRVFGIAATYGGYVSQSNVSSGSVGQGYASFQLRVPSGRLTDAIAALSHLGRVRSETDTTNDVTGEDESLNRRLGDLRAERASVLHQIAAASEAAAVAKLRARLHAVEGQIGSVEGSLHALQQRVSYSPLAFSLTAEAAAGGSTSGSSLTPGSALGVAGDILTAALAVLVIAAAAALPLGLAVLVGGAALARSRRQARERALGAG